MKIDILCLFFSSKTAVLWKHLILLLIFKAHSTSLFDIINLIHVNFHVWSSVPILFLLIWKFIIKLNLFLFIT